MYDDCKRTEVNVMEEVETVDLVGPTKFLKLLQYSGTIVPTTGRIHIQGLKRKLPSKIAISSSAFAKLHQCLSVQQNCYKQPVTDNITRKSLRTVELQNIPIV